MQPRRAEIQLSARLERVLVCKVHPGGVSELPGHLIAQIRTDSAWNTEEVLVEIHRSRTQHLAIVVREAK